MKTRVRTGLWLAATLIVGQWLLLAHTTDHPELASDAGCDICLVAQAASGPAPDTASLALPAPIQIHTRPALHQDPDAPRPRTPAIRAPPVNV